MTNISGPSNSRPWCICTGKRQKEGWRFGGVWFWVHHGCGLPAKAFVENFLVGEQNVAGTTVNLFHGGPHHNEVWTNDELLYGTEDRPTATWIAEYRWTPETIVGSKTGRLARVWVWPEQTSS